MREEARKKRQDEIAAAAYALIDQGGYAAVTMQSVAKNAGASMETLYRWYGDRLGLFRALVANNAEAIRSLLEAAIAGDDNPLAALESVGCQLLAMLTGPRAVALNKAAAADPAGELGAALAQAGRDTVAPLVGTLIERAVEKGLLAEGARSDGAELYLGLLIGDLQIRRVTGQIGPLEKRAIEHRSSRAVDMLTRLYPPGA